MSKIYIWHSVNWKHPKGWTQKQTEILKNNYLFHSNNWLSKKTDKSISAVQGKMQRMGLLRTTWKKGVVNLYKHKCAYCKTVFSNKYANTRFCNNGCKGKSMVKIDLKKAQVLYMSGSTQQVIADKQNIHLNTVNRNFSKYGYST